MRFTQLGEAKNTHLQVRNWLRPTYTQNVVGLDACNFNMDKKIVDVGREMLESSAEIQTHFRRLPEIKVPTLWYVRLR